MRVLHWTGWGTDHLFEHWRAGAEVADGFQTYWAFRGDGEGARQAVVVDPMRAPHRPPTYWWDAHHRWFVFTNIDGDCTFVGTSTPATASALLDLPDSVLVTPQDLQ